jgi:hypothetical protein
MPERFADLHIHTNFSDGRFSPGQVVEYSQRVGLSAISITDHDMIEGIRLAREAAGEYDMEIISGIELSAEDRGREVHILGYCFDEENSELQEKLRIFCAVRLKRAQEMVEKLNELGLEIDFDRVLTIAGPGSVGKPHVAQAMVERGYVNSVAQASMEYLSSARPAYVPKYKLEPGGGIELIRRAGGIPVLAHPALSRVDELIPQMVSCGLMGLEVYEGSNDPSMINYYTGLARKYGLLITGGSDCHQRGKDRIRMGSTKLPYRFVEELKHASPR